MHVNATSPSTIKFDSIAEKQNKTEGTQQRKGISNLFERKPASTPRALSQRIGSTRQSKIANNRTIAINLGASNLDANATILDPATVSPEDDLEAQLALARSLDKAPMESLNPSGNEILRNISNSTDEENVEQLPDELPSHRPQASTEQTRRPAMCGLPPTPVTVSGALPEGAKIDDKGNLSGTSILSQVPSAEEHSKVSPQKRMLLEVHLNKVAYLLLHGKPAFIQGQYVTHQASQDIQALDMTFVHKNGNMFYAPANKPDLTGTTLDPLKEHQKVIISALKDMTGGSASAVTALSAVFNKVFLTSIWKALCTEDGKERAHLRLIGNGKHRTLIREDGTPQTITAKGISGAKLTLLHEDGNYKLMLDWQAYAEAEPEHTNLLPLAKDTVIGVHFQAGFLIDGNQARQGKLDIALIDGGIKATFSGRLKMGT